MFSSIRVAGRDREPEDRLNDPSLRIHFGVRTEFAFSRMHIPLNLVIIRKNLLEDEDDLVNALYLPPGLLLCRPNISLRATRSLRQTVGR